MVSLEAAGGTASRAASQVRDGSVELVAGHHERRQPDRGGLGRTHPSAGQADLQGPGVPDRVDQRPGAPEVRDDAAARLGHAQLRVVGQHPQVAGQRELEAAADAVALDGCHARRSAASATR